MAVMLKLKRMGTKHKPFYRLVAIDKRAATASGKALEYLGMYNPKANPKVINFNKEKVDAWLKKGATPSDTVKKLLEKLASK